MGQNEGMYSIDIQHIDLTEFAQKDRILDIGGGGEGVIGQLSGERQVNFIKYLGEDLGYDWE